MAGAGREEATSHVSCEFIDVSLLCATVRREVGGPGGRSYSLHSESKSTAAGFVLEAVELVTR
jgi:hypothetical protein